MVRCFRESHPGGRRTDQASIPNTAAGSSFDAIADRVEIEPCDGGIRITMEFTRATQDARLVA